MNFLWFLSGRRYFFFSKTFGPKSFQKPSILVRATVIDTLVWWPNRRWALKTHFRFEWSRTDYDFWSRFSRSAFESVHCISLRTSWPSVGFFNWLFKPKVLVHLQAVRRCTFGRVQLWICIKIRGPRDGTGLPRTNFVPIRPWNERGRGRLFQIQTERGRPGLEVFGLRTGRGRPEKSISTMWS